MHRQTHTHTHRHTRTQNKQKNTNVTPSVLDWFAVDLTLSKAVETRFGQPMRKLMRINSWPLWWPSSVIEMYGHQLPHAYSSGPQTGPDRYTKASSVQSQSQQTQKPRTYAHAPLARTSVRAHPPTRGRGANTLHIASTLLVFSSFP